MSNGRRGRRSVQRGRGGVRQGAVARPKPVGAHGLEVDLGDDGLIHFTYHAGECAVTICFQRQDAELASDLLRKAAAGEDKPQPEVVRRSGLVVARTIE